MWSCGLRRGERVREMSGADELKNRRKEGFCPKPGSPIFYVSNGPDRSPVAGSTVRSGCETLSTLSLSGPPFQVYLGTPTSDAAPWSYYSRGITLFSREMKFSYDFVAESSIKQEIEDLVLFRGVKIRHHETCHVLRFQTREQVFRVTEALCRIRFPFTTTGLSCFQLKADSWSWWYLVFVLEGIPFREFIAAGLLEEYSSISCKKSNPLFISDGYATMIKNIVTSALLLMPTPVRCRIQIGSTFAWMDFMTFDIRACFVRYDVQGQHQIDELQILSELETLFLDIMKQSGIGAGPEAEFDLFLETFGHGCQNLDLNHKIDLYKPRIPIEWYYNVLFATKNERMKFIEKLYELIRSENCVIYCDETKDAFGKDWHEKLYSIYVQLMKDGSWKTDGSDDWIKKRDASFSGPSLEDVDMKRCIASISEMCHNFVNSEECDRRTKHNKVEQLVELLHEAFPFHIVALARGASAMKWPLTMDLLGSANTWPIPLKPYPLFAMPSKPDVSVKATMLLAPPQCGSSDDHK